MQCPENSVRDPGMEVCMCLDDYFRATNGSCVSCPEGSVRTGLSENMCMCTGDLMSPSGGVMTNSSCGK